MADADGRTPENIALIENALRLVNVYTTQDKGVIINYRADDVKAEEALIAAFGYAGGTPFLLGETRWHDRTIPAWTYEYARPICLEQEAARQKVRDDELLAA